VTGRLGAERVREQRQPLAHRGGLARWSTRFSRPSREGDFEALLEVLDPDVVLRVDFGPASGSRVVRGAREVAGQLFYSRLELVMQPALVNGAVGAVSTRDGEPFSVGAVTVRGGKIVEIDILADPERLSHLDLTILDG
jgi:ketosteroid isomerase-like protein